MKQFKFHFILFFVALIYAATFSIAKDVMPKYLGSYAFIVMRVGTATALFWIVHALFVKEKVKSLKDYKEFFIAGFFGVAANMTMFFKGLETTSPIHGAVLMLAAPVFVLIFQKYVYKVRIVWIQWIGIILAMSGATILILHAGTEIGNSSITGDLLIMMNAISYAFYIVYVKRILEKYNFLTVAKWAFTFAFIMVLPVGFTQLSEADFSAFPTEIWLEIAFVLFGTTFLTYLLNAYAVQNTSPALVGSYIYLQPVLATAIAIAWGKDFLTIEKICLAILIFVGVYLVSKKKK